LFRIPTTGLRFFTVYGPWGRPDMAIFKFVDAVVSGRSIDLYNFGHLRRDFTFVDDIVEGIVRILPRLPELSGDSLAPMRLCNIGNQRPVELLHLIRTIELCLGRTAIIRLLPMQPGDVNETQANVDRLKNVTGYSPRISIEQGVERFVKWYLSEYVPLGLGAPPVQLPPLKPAKRVDRQVTPTSVGSVGLQESAS
jgi:UDP-glucuronate 4-epimerase